METVASLSKWGLHNAQFSELCVRTLAHYTRYTFPRRARKNCTTSRHPTTWRRFDVRNSHPICRGLPFVPYNRRGSAVIHEGSETVNTRQGRETRSCGKILLSQGSKYVIIYLQAYFLSEDRGHKNTQRQMRDKGTHCIVVRWSSTRGPLRASNLIYVYTEAQHRHSSEMVCVWSLVPLMKKSCVVKLFLEYGTWEINVRSLR